MTEDLQAELNRLLSEELRILEKATDILNYSYKNCQAIGVKEKYSYEELDKFEALTSRFCRLIDFLIQQIFRLIEKIELEDPGSARDSINRAEKRGLIESADVFIKIRLLRNQIVHEYEEEELQGIFGSVLEYTPHLLDSANRVKQYVKKYTTQK
jgi:uncharacterized protein YutE (UPF0331/DUF86 family)